MPQWRWMIQSHSKPIKQWFLYIWRMKNVPNDDEDDNENVDDNDTSIKMW